MARLRAGRNRLREILLADDWHVRIPEIADLGMASVGPLFSFLPGDPLRGHRAAAALGATVAEIYKTEPEKAKNICRRFMWHMSEESGNIGWGIPEAFAETLAACKPLAEIYRNILVSYIIDLGHDDNYCDNDILRRSCYWGIGRFARAWPEMAEKARDWLIKGLTDRDDICRGMAAWALWQLPHSLSDAPALKKLALADDKTRLSIFESGSLNEYEVSKLAKKALNQ